jgi:FtsH-binding integral membrane protein
VNDLSPRPIRPAVAFAFDLGLVLAFCVIGRASHAEALFDAGFLATAGPFVAGLAIGWALVVLRLRRRPDGLAAGGVVLAATVVGGMLLRAASGQGTATAFVVVAVITLALFLLGWRVVARVTRRTRHTA